MKSNPRDTTTDPLAGEYRTPTEPERMTPDEQTTLADTMALAAALTMGDHAHTWNPELPIHVASFIRNKLAALTLHVEALHTMQDESDSLSDYQDAMSCIKDLNRLANMFSPPLERTRP